MIRHPVHLPTLAGIGAVLIGVGVYVTLAYEPAAQPTISEQRDHIRQLLDHGKLNRAETLARRLMDQQDSPSSATCLLSEILLAQHRDIEAIALLHSIQRSVRDPQVLEMLGRALMGSGKIDAGQRQLQAALKLEPGRIGAIKALAQTYLIQDRDADASVLLEPVIDELALQLCVAQLALRQNDATRLTRFIEPLNAITVENTLAMVCNEPVKQAKSNTSWHILTQAWKKQPNPDAAHTLITLLLDRMDDPLLSTRPLSVPRDPSARLLELAQQRWPDEPAWDRLVFALPDHAPVSPPAPRAALLALVLDDTTPARHWDAAMAQLDEQLGSKALLTLIQQSGRTDALALTWRATLHHASDQPAEARGAIKRAVQLQPRSPRVLHVMTELTPTASTLDAVWPGSLGR